VDLETGSNSGITNVPGSQGLRYSTSKLFVLSEGGRMLVRTPIWEIATAVESTAGRDLARAYIHGHARSRRRALHSY
jgi:hypothetical protein